MVHAFPTASPKPRPRPRWPRVRQRRWARPNDLPGTATLFAAIPSLPRAVLSRLTTRMIDRMDEIDGDPDLEHLSEDDEESHDQEQEEAHE